MADIPILGKPASGGDVYTDMLRQQLHEVLYNLFRGPPHLIPRPEEMRQMHDMAENIATVIMSKAQICRINASFTAADASSYTPPGPLSAPLTLTDRVNAYVQNVVRKEMVQQLTAALFQQAGLLHFGAWDSENGTRRNIQLNLAVLPPLLNTEGVKSEVLAASSSGGPV